MTCSKRLSGRDFISLLAVIAISSCGVQNKSFEEEAGSQADQPVTPTIAISEPLAADSGPGIDENIRSIFQDRSGAYWFGTNDAGVYQYKGGQLSHFTVEDGLADNQVQSIQEDKAGNLWLGTGGFGVSRFDGKTFRTFTGGNTPPRTKDWEATPDDLWFYAGGGVYRHDGTSLSYLPLGEAVADRTSNPPNKLSRYAVYSILKDRKGQLWFGTQSQGVCRYDGKNFTWITEKNLAGPAVLSIFEDKAGNIWFGNNGAGLFRYDGQTLVSITEERGLGNKEFRASGMGSPGTLARVYSINEDNYGNLWVGTVDAGVWKFNGSSQTNYTTKDGLTSNAVNTIYKDRSGELWFGADANGICRFNGQTFTKFEIR